MAPARRRAALALLLAALPLPLLSLFAAPLAAGPSDGLWFHVTDTRDGLTIEAMAAQPPGRYRYQLDVVTRTATGNRSTVRQGGEVRLGQTPGVIASARIAPHAAARTDVAVELFRGEALVAVERQSFGPGP